MESLASNFLFKLDLPDEDKKKVCDKFLIRYRALPYQYRHLNYPGRPGFPSFIFPNGTTKTTICQFFIDNYDSWSDFACLTSNYSFISSDRLDYLNKRNRTLVDLEREVTVKSPAEMALFCYVCDVPTELHKSIIRKYRKDM